MRRWFKREKVESSPDPCAYLMPWDDFKAGIDNPETRDATIERTLYEIANGPTYAHLTYDPFTLKSRIYGPNVRYQR